VSTEPRRLEPAAGIFRLVLPLPFPGLKRVNAYLLAGDDEAMLVDCGLFDPMRDDDGGWGLLTEAIEACDVPVSGITSLLVTHPHIDHYGMASRVASETGCRVLMHRHSIEELRLYEDPDAYVESLRELLADHGVRSEDLEELSGFEDWRGFVSGVIEADRLLDDGDALEVGGRRWEVVYTPGHSPSHICLHERNESILISGDHLLPGITPHIDFQRDARQDPLGDFLASLERIEELHPHLVLPGHGKPFDDGAERARAIARHHERRLGSILQVIRKKPLTASEITDEIFGATLLNFQRRLALGEVLAHLAYLRVRGEVERTEGSDGTFLYRKASRRVPAQEDD
jgi:glyoxylase-like metal-dependent hydrolase (beta-lactamase superfamily II)